jgi:hypothetical protein
MAEAAAAGARLQAAFSRGPGRAPPRRARAQATAARDAEAEPRRLRLDT